MGAVALIEFMIDASWTLNAAETDCVTSAELRRGPCDLERPDAVLPPPPSAEPSAPPALPSGSAALAGFAKSLATSGADEAPSSSSASGEGGGRYVRVVVTRPDHPYAPHCRRRYSSGSLPRLGEERVAVLLDEARRVVLDRARVVVQHEAVVDLTARETTTEREREREKDKER